ncbi:MAG: hypothetical protein JNM17_03245 [Archangium sp.]|nr:hypothetical protein [Archangium sp.]
MKPISKIAVFFSVVLLFGLMFWMAEGRRLTWIDNEVEEELSTQGQVIVTALSLMLVGAVVTLAWWIIERIRFRSR